MYTGGWLRNCVHMCLAPDLEDLWAVKCRSALDDFAYVKANCVIIIEGLIWKNVNRIVVVLISDTTRNWRKQQQGKISKGENKLDATNSDLLVINSISICFGHLYAHHQEIRLRSTAYNCLSCCSCCDAGESGGKMCALCGKCCLTLHTVHTSCHPTLQHHSSYNRTDSHRQWNAVGPPDDGHKDARNMLRYYWLPINHYLLHLVGFSFTYLSKMHGHSNIKEKEASVRIVRFFVRLRTGYLLNKSKTSDHLLGLRSSCVQENDETCIVGKVLKFSTAIDPKIQFLQISSWLAS